MSIATLRFFCGLVLVGLVFLSFTLESAEARYMPTRADPVRREQIRELIKAVLELAPADAAHNNYGAYEYGAPSGLKGLERND